MNFSWKIKYWKYNDLTLFGGSVRTFHFLSSVVNRDGKCLVVFHYQTTFLATFFCCGVKAYRKLRARQARDDQRWRDTRDLVRNESLARRAYLALHAHVPHPRLRSPNLNTQDKSVVHAGSCGKSCKRKKLAWFLLKPSV